MSMNVSTAEEQDAQKSKINQERIRKLTEDRQQHNGNTRLAQTDGLRTIRTNGKRKGTIVIDEEFEIDPRRIRKLKDVITDEME